MKCLREWVEKNHQPFVSECVCVGVQMKWKSERQRLDVCVKWGILSCYEFGMFWNRKVHVGFSTGWCVHTQRVRRALHHPPITTAPTGEKNMWYHLPAHTCTTRKYYVHFVSFYLSFHFLFFLVCAEDLFSFGSTTVPLSFMHCQHPCLAFMNHTHTKNQMKEATERKKKRA